MPEEEPEEEKEAEEQEREEEEEEGPGALARFFSAIGSGVIKTGEATKKASGGVTKVGGSGGAEEAEERPDLSERLQELKSLETEKERLEEEYGEEGVTEGEEERWESEREELQRPASERLAEIFSGVFGGISSKLADFYTFSGLDEELDRANMGYTPEQFIGLLLGIGLIVSVSAFVFVWFFFSALILAFPISGVCFIVVVFVGRNRPRSKISSRASEVNQEIPYVLRHMATQLSSGVGLPETMTSVSNAGYGALSEEFERTLQEMKMGKSMSQALTELQERVDSDSLRRAIRQIQRTIKTGGDLSRTLDILADETATELRMKLRDYTQSLNMMTMIYMFAAAVIPSMLVVITIVTTFMGGAFLPPTILTILYLMGIPFLLFYMVMIFRQMEPEV